MDDPIDKPNEVPSQLEAEAIAAVATPLDVNKKTAAAAAESVPAEPKKKKKKKKKKLSAKEKQLEKLEKLAEKFVEDHARFNEFVKFMAFWLKANQATCMKLLKKQVIMSNEVTKMMKVVKPVVKLDGEDGGDDGDDDEEKDEDNEEDDEEDDDDEVELISHDDFKLVLEDLDIPCTAIELHVLCKLLDQEATGFIEYKNLTPDNMKRFINHEYADGVRLIKSAKIPDKKAPSQYPIFDFKHWKPLMADVYPRYVQLDIKLATFANDKEFKGHIRDEIIYSHMTIFCLIEFIKKRADIASVHVAVFKDSSRNKTVKLEESKTLEECGYIGATYDAPNQYTVFYDYLTSRRDDPIMNSDFYFINSKYTYTPPTVTATAVKK